MELWTVIKKEKYIKKTTDEQVIVDFKGVAVLVEKRQYDQNQIDEFLRQTNGYMFEYRTVYEETL